MKIFKKMKKGFTLVELVVVIAVIAILAAVSVGAYFGVTDSANASKLEQEAKQVHTAIQTVALAPNEHSSLTSSGLTITDIANFEKDLEGNLGINVALTDVQDQKDPTKPTIYFVPHAISPAFGDGTIYSGFEYYNHQIGGKRAVADVVTGKVDVINKDETTSNIFDNDKSYNLVTAVNQISVGDKIVIAAADLDVALSTTQNNNNRGETSIFRDGERIIATDETQVITLEAGVVEGTFAFKVDEGYLYAASSSANHLKTKSELDENGSWLITINEGVASVSSQGNYTRNKMQYNSDSKLFSCYGNTDQKDISLYRFGAYIPCEHDFGDNLEKCSKCGEENPDYVAPVPQLIEATIEQAIDIAKTLSKEDESYDYYQISGTVIREETSSTKVYLSDGTNRIQVYKSGQNAYENLYEGYFATVKGKLKNFNGNTPEVFNFELVDSIPVKYTITIPTFEHGSITASANSDIDWGTVVTLTVTPNINYEVKKVLVNGVEVELNNNTCEVIVEKNIIVSAEFVESGTLPQTESATLTFDDTTKRTEFSTSKQVWEENGIKVTNNKGSGNNIANYSKPVRFYQGSEVIVEREEMLEISFKCNDNTYANNLKTSIGDEASINNNIVKVEFTTSTSSFDVTLAAQVRIDSITVKFVQSSSSGSEETCQHDYSSVVTPATCTQDGYITYTCSSCNDTYTEEGTKATGHTFVEGKCACGEEDPNYGVATSETTVTKTVKDLITQYDWDENTTKQSFNLDENVSVKIDGGANSGKAYNGNEIRIYATDTPAGTLTFTLPNTYEFVSIKISTKTGSTNAHLCVNGTSTDISNKLTSISGNELQINSVKNGTSGKNSPITGFEVTYKTK